MSYWLSKTLSLVIYPLGTASLLFAIAVLLLAFRRRSQAIAALLLGVAWLFTWSLPAVADTVTRYLEDNWRYETAAAYPTADAIVILGGAFSSGLGEWPYPDAGARVDRYWHGARLYRAGRAPRVILSGGRNPRRPDSWSEAESGAMLLADMGVPRSAMILDSEARTTRENALYIGAILRRENLHSILLVTSAGHMRRSLAAMAHLNIDVTAAPADFSALKNPVVTFRRYLPAVNALTRSTVALHEIVGLVVYRLRGWA